MRVLRARWPLWCMLGLVLLARLASLGAYPLFETTEPRYAEMARKMLALGDWVTPWFDDGVPFWGKPPLSFWGSAATMALFGVNEFGARLAPFLASLLTLALLWAWPRPLGHTHTLPTLAALVMLSSLLGFVSAGAVMTDMFMTLGTTLCMLAFWRAYIGAAHAKRWSWAFFVGLALGLLAKGPVATVLTLLPIGLWAVCARQVMPAWRALPWLRGGLLCAALTLPWYLLAEAHTPGFLAYFLVGEHWQRFLVPGWAGDLYGHAHTEPRGTIWWFALAGYMPWPVVALVDALRAWRAGMGLRSPAQAASGAVVGPRSEAVTPRAAGGYLWCWVLAAPLFFSLAGNVIPPYVLPGLPAFALLTAHLALATPCSAGWQRIRLAAGLLVPALLCALVWGFPQVLEQRSQRALLHHWPVGEPLAYAGARPFSASFYSSGQARWLATPQQLAQWLAQPGPASVVLQEQAWQITPELQKAGWRLLAQHADYRLLHRDAAAAPAVPAAR